eukprot:CAMPEP_0172448790 /NCGR_PEP_ID=MMETSP1065-20121228/7730_1 /TAXON_ID=265537 /ORGANISM="Amphiprora paludosa, Strain CCMP125" /LENGTH=484 /DNA_ID=CAMNT_0013200379 /DNA_START=140 /DNA_END=1594 /DNA_ORIENTATION=+
MARRGGTQRRNYAQVSSSDDPVVVDEEQGGAAQDGIAPSGPLVDESLTPSTSGTNLTEASSLLTDGEENTGEVDLEKGTAAADDAEAGDEENWITVVILDVAQKKFHVKVPETATVQQLKEAGAKIHKVSPDRQRLIYRGKMLQDEDEELQQLNIGSKTIVHLFPKPRVVIQSHNTNGTDAENNNADNPADHENGGEDNDEEEGARVPTIVLNEREAESRSQILVLGSADYMEAQNNVKLFSFMLLIISSIELMNLFALALGVPQDEEDGVGGGGSTSPDEYDITIDDDIFDTASDDVMAAANATLDMASSSSGFEIPPWRAANWFDLVISLMGVYVGILGLQATSLNTLQLAKRYMIGTVSTGLGWMAFNLVMTYDLDKRVEKEREENDSDDLLLLNDSDLRWQAVSAMILPGMVWLLCCLRAWQFQHLISEAEVEAEERIRSEFANVVTRAEGSGDAEEDVVDNEPNHDEELTLQNESARIS